MARLPKSTRRSLQNILYHLERAERYVLDDAVVIAQKQKFATTNLHLKREDGLILYPVCKDIGSDIVGLYMAKRLLAALLAEREGAE